MTETNSGDPLSWKKQVSVPHVAICIHLVPMKSKEFDGGQNGRAEVGVSRIPAFRCREALYLLYFDASNKSLKHVGSSCSDL